MSLRNDVKTFGVIGTGVIGAGWSARALARGLDVVAWDPGAGAEEKLRAAIDNAWPALAKLRLFPGADRARLRVVDSPEAVCEVADFVQESAPDRLELKRDLHTRLDAVTPADVLIASSSSGLLPTDIARDCAHPERIVIGHPFNPVYLLPLVELMGGQGTAPAALEAARALYQSIGMHPLLVRNEIEGYLSDRLQEALWRENLHLVNDGIATTAELDEAIVYGPGLRWAFMGVNKTFHLAGGEQGMRHMLEQFGPALELPWTKLKAPELTDELINRMVEGTEAQAQGKSVRELERLRDDCLVAVMQALRSFREGAGEVLQVDYERLERAVTPRQWQPGDVVAAPLQIYTSEVKAAWIDYNGHMTAPTYPLAFDDALEALFNYFGHDADYRTRGGALFTAETHFNYYRECKVGEQLNFTAQIIGTDEKRVHVYTSMYDAASGELRATSEQMYLHVNTLTSKVTPMEPGLIAALQAIHAAHAALDSPADAGRAIGQRR